MNILLNAIQLQGFKYYLFTNLVARITAPI
jgi:hypothetical protein